MKLSVASAELVWESGKDRGKKPLSLAQGSRAQGKLLWDIAELQIQSGGEVRYWVEAKDNDTVSGPNIGRSKEFHLRVVSPRGTVTGASHGIKRKGTLARAS